MIAVNEKLTNALMVHVPVFICQLWVQGIDVMVGGSFVRLAIHEQETPRDIDLYGDQETIDALMAHYPVIRENIYSVDLEVPESRFKVNLVNKMPCPRARDYIDTIDFSISAAVLAPVRSFRPTDPIKPTIFAVPEWEDDVRERRIRYIRSSPYPSPRSLPRVLSLYERGYTIDAENLAAVVAAVVRDAPTMESPAFERWLERSFLNGKADLPVSNVIEGARS